VIDGILAQSREHNPDAGITGVLCVCCGDVFMQVLEGGREEVNQLYCRLVQDARHTDVTILDYAEISERRFSGWRMGRVDMDRLNTGVVLKYSEKPRFDPFKISGRVALALLEDLISTASIMGGG
jgi:hypothetical protein